MSALPHRKIIDKQDDPLVAALIRFVTDTLSRSLDDISTWDIVQKDPDSRCAEFSIRFGYGTEGYTGSIVRGIGGWGVLTYQSEIFMIGMHPIVSMEAHNQQ